MAWATQEILGAGAPDIRESSRYALRQTSSPAVFTNLLPLDDRNTERFLSQPRNVSREAYAIYAALLHQLGYRDTLPGKLTVEVTLPDGAGPAGGAAVTLDGYLSLLTDQHGRADLVLLENEDHVLEISLRGYHTALHEFRWPTKDTHHKVVIELEAQ